MAGARQNIPFSPCVPGGPLYSAEEDPRSIFPQNIIQLLADSASRSLPPDDWFFPTGVSHRIAFVHFTARRI